MADRHTLNGSGEGATLSVASVAMPIRLVERVVLPPPSNTHIESQKPQGCPAGMVRARLCPAPVFNSLPLTRCAPATPEGRVFYSDQGAVFTEATGGDGDDLTGGVSRSQARRKFADFLRCFRGEPSPGRVDGATLYRDCLDADPPPRTLQVVLEDLLAFDAQLADALKKNPRTFVPLVRQPPGCPVCLCGCKAAV